VYEDEGVEQLVFELRKGRKQELVGYCEFAYEIVGTDSWMNHRYFEKRGMRPLFVEELAVHPDYHGLGVGSFIFEQIEHAARLRGCTHIVLEVAENNEPALRFYRKRGFRQAGRRNLPGAQAERGGRAPAAAQDRVAEARCVGGRGLIGYR
jgi:ribosomal protein S18 acetylase RimI-like enzyme